MKKNIFLVGLFALLILTVYKVLFYFLPISGGDYINVTIPQLFTWKYFSFNVWSTNIDLGWGIIPLLSSAPYSLLIGWVGGFLGNNGWIVERVFWWIPFLILGFISSLMLSRKLTNSLFSYMAPLLFVFNTYIFLIISGGQIAGIGLAYTLAPFVILSYLNLTERQTFRNSLITGLVLAIQLMFDLRMTYVTLVGIGMYLLIRIIFELRITNYGVWNIKKLFKHISLVIVLPGVIVGLLHAFWLIPMAIFRQNPLQQLGSAYNTTDAVKFFSFAKFEDAMGLLHPNWPENIFGLTHFMRPEFLLLPILAFGSLLFLNSSITNDELRVESKNLQSVMRNKQIYLIYFVLLGLLGIFLAKGTSDPFGNIYLWCFQHIPGFVMFRDPTKWYLLIAISYSVLIPFTVRKIYEWLKERFAN